MVRGYFLAGPEMNYIAFGAEGRGQNPYEIIFHEYEHFITRNNLFHAPLWLDEGLAEFYSTFETSDTDLKATLGAPVTRHVLYLRNHEILPLKTLFAVDRRSPYYNEAGKVGTFYAQSWALVHYLMLANDGKRRSQFAEFIRLLDRDTPVEESFRQAFQVDYRTIEKEVANYAFRGTYPVLFATFLDKLTAEKDIQSTTLSEAEVQYYLGDLLLRNNRPKDAESRLQKSISLDAKFAPSRVSLGLLYLRQDRLEDAQAALRLAIETDPTNYLAHFYFAQALAAAKQFDEAIKSYKEAIRLRPQAAFMLLSLGKACLAAGKEKDAIVAFGQGTQVDPRNPAFFRNLGHVFLRRAQGEYAANDATSFIRISGWHDDYSGSMALVKYYGLRQVRREDDARQALEEAAAKLDPAAWPYPIIRYLRHDLALNELLNQAVDNDKLTQARAYVGLNFSLNGDRAAGLEHLRWVKEKGNQSLVEYPLALAEIERIESAPVGTPSTRFAI